MESLLHRMGVWADYDLSRTGLNQRYNYHGRKIYFTQG